MKSKRTTPSSRLGPRSVALLCSLGFFVASPALLTLPGCSSESDATSGKRVALATQFRAVDVTSGFTTGAGYTVALTKALLATGPLYYFEGAPIEARGPAWSLVKSAFAHPGHYQPGDNNGEMLTEWSVDLLAGPADLPAGKGVTGLYRSGTFSFGQGGAGPVASALDGHVVLVEGSATALGQERPFVAFADVQDLIDASGELVLEGCPFDEADVRSDGTVVITVNLPLWLDQVDFAAVTLDPSGTAVLERGTSPHKAFLHGLRKAAAYRFSYEN